MKIIIHSKKSIKYYRLSKFLLIILSIVFFLVSVIGGLSYFFISNSSNSLIVENKNLKSNIISLSNKLESIQNELSQIYEQEKKLRLAAGLDLDFNYATGGSEETFNFNKNSYSNISSLKAATEKLIEEINLQKLNFKQIEQKLLEKKDFAERIPAILPMNGVLSEHSFGMRLHPILRYWRMHEGIDINGQFGSPILAAGGGIVKFAGWNGSLGLCVIIDHGYGYETTYGHLSRINVKVGQTVKRFLKIGECGSTGLSTGPHLHYEVSFNGEKQNPLYYIFR